MEIRMFIFGFFVGAMVIYILGKLFKYLFGDGEVTDEASACCGASVYQRKVKTCLSCGKGCKIK